MTDTTTTRIRDLVLGAIKDRSIAKYDELLPEAIGSEEGIVQAVEWLCEQIKLKGVKIYVETDVGMWQWGTVDDDGLTSSSYGMSLKGSIYVATSTLTAALSYVAGKYDKYELYVVDGMWETQAIEFLQHSPQSAADLVQMMDELNLVVYTGTQEQVRKALRDIATK